MTPLWDIRDVRPEEIAWIYASWLNSYRYGSTLGKSCRNSIFFAHYPLVMDDILAKSTVKVAADLDNPKVAFAYIVSDEKTLHYVFVKEPFRRFGIATDLYQFVSNQAGYLSSTTESIAFYTHRTKDFQAFAKARLKDESYNPFLLYRKFGELEE